MCLPIGVVKVQWDSSMAPQKYRYGKDNQYDITPVDLTEAYRLLCSEELIGTGCCVRRGKALQLAYLPTSITAVAGDPRSLSHNYLGVDNA